MVMLEKTLEYKLNCRMYECMMYGINVGMQVQTESGVKLCQQLSVYFECNCVVLSITSLTCSRWSEWNYTSKQGSLGG